MLPPKSSIYCYLVITSAWLISLLSWNPLLAAQLEHHDFMVDDNSYAACLECHDDKESDSSLKELSGNHALHPINLSYPPATSKHPKGKNSPFKSKSEAEASGIRFQNGQLTCLSCHNLANPGQGHLTIDNSGSRLCMACHKL